MKLLIYYFPSIQWQYSGLAAINQVWIKALVFKSLTMSEKDVINFDCWMGGQEDGWVDKWVDRWVDRWIDR